MSLVLVVGLSCLTQDAEASVGLPVSLSEPQQALARLGALVFSPGLLHCWLETLGLHCFSERLCSRALEVDTGVEVEVEIEVVGAAAAGAAPSLLRHPTQACVLQWPCHSGRLLAAWRWVASSHWDPHWGRRCPQIHQAPCRGSLAVASRWTTLGG